jgi:hypothetical protein
MEKLEEITVYKGFYDKELSNIKDLNQEKLPLEYEIENFIRKVKKDDQNLATNDLRPEGENKLSPLPYNIARLIAFKIAGFGVAARGNRYSMQLFFFCF